MSNLIERIRKGRQTRVEAEGFVFTCRRPTDLEMIELQMQKVTQGDILDKFVIGWEGVNEIDLVPGGDPTPVEFSQELFSEWVADKPTLWAPLTDAIVGEYKAHSAKLAEVEKK